MDQISQVLILIILVVSIFNFLTARTIKPAGKPIAESVAVLIPMRNEAKNAVGVVNSALAQIQLDHLQVRALDDGSEDGTGEELSHINDQRFEVIEASQLPDGWLGKNHALHLLAERSNEEFLVFMDADVRLEKSAIADSITLMKKEDWDFISPYPRQIAKGLLPKLVQPLLQWSWFASLPLRLVERSRRASTVVANGQFFIVRNSLYQKAGGHIEIRAEVLDDMELARLLRKSGGIGSVVDGSRSASCEMYPDSQALIDGYSKSQWRAFGGSFGAIFAIAFLFLSSIYPVIRGFGGEMWGLFGYLAMFISRALTALRTRSVLITAPLHPVAIAMWIALIIRSMILKRSGRLQWRGRTI